MLKQLCAALGWSQTPTGYEPDTYKSGDATPQEVAFAARTLARPVADAANQPMALQTLAMIAAYQTGVEARRSVAARHIVHLG